MSKLIFEFPDDKARDEFISMFCNSIEQDVFTYCEIADKPITNFDYKKAIKGHGWNGKDDPIIVVENE